MPGYTVTVEFPPVTDDNWEPMHRLLDIFDGSFLIENEEAPTLIAVVDADRSWAAINAVVKEVWDLGFRGMKVYAQRFAEASS